MIDVGFQHLIPLILLVLVYFLPTDTGATPPKDREGR
jgi:hypothetical protein